MATTDNEHKEIKLTLAEATRLQSEDEVIVIDPEENAKRSVDMAHETISKFFNRDLTEAEEKYVRQWISWGMDKDIITMAYERTVLNTGSLNFAYMHAILKHWHNSWCHTKEAVLASEQNPTQNITKWSEIRKAMFTPEQVRLADQLIELHKLQDFLQELQNQLQSDLLPAAAHILLNYPHITPKDTDNRKLKALAATYELQSYLAEEFTRVEAAGCQEAPQAPKKEKIPLPAKAYNYGEIFARFSEEEELRTNSGTGEEESP